MSGVKSSGEVSCLAGLRSNSERAVGIKVQLNLNKCEDL